MSIRSLTFCCLSYKSTIIKSFLFLVVVYTTACIRNIISGCLCSRKKEGLFVWLMEILWIISDIHVSQSHERHRRVSTRHSVGRIVVCTQESISHMVTNTNPFFQILIYHFTSALDSDATMTNCARFVSRNLHFNDTPVNSLRIFSFPFLKICIKAFFIHSTKL